MGTTRLTAATGSQTGLILGIADQRGDGRPDFRYQARVLYADNLSPVQIPDAGGVVTISGMGFRAGNTVTVNGVGAAVVTSSSNALVVRLPSRSAAGAGVGQAVDVKVADQGTGGSSTLSAAVTYGAPVGAARLMKLLTVQAGAVDAGAPTPVPFAVQMLAADGVTPVANEPVAFTVNAGSARFGACGLAACTVLSDASGVATTAVTPLVAGQVGVQAVDGVLSQSGAFTAREPAASIKVLLGPASTALANDAYQPLIVQVLDGNGNGMGGRLVEFTTTSGSAIFDRCAALSCALITDSSGVSVVQFMPTQVGQVTVRAASGSAEVSVSTTATDNSDVLLLVRAPDAMQFVGQAEAMTVKLLKHDGVSFDAGKPVVFTGSDGVIFPTCGLSTCTTVTSSDGLADLALRTGRTGTFEVTASYGNLSRTVHFTVVAATASIRIVSAPSGTVSVNQMAATPFVVQVIGADGVTPYPGARIALAGAADSVLLEICSGGGCALNTDANGMVATRVKPLRTGTITLDALAGSLLASTSFESAGGVRSMHVVSAPGAAGVQVGERAIFKVQVLEPDGVTPLVGGFVEFATSYGSFLVGTCGYSHCSVQTDDNGMATMTGFALAPGITAVTATATFATLSQTMTFPAFAKGQVMRLVTAPSGNVLVGSAASAPMTVQMLDKDGITPLPGQPVTFAVTQGQARLGACAAAVCTLTTDASGMALTAVTPTGPGAIAVQASSDATNQTATLTGVQPPDVLTVLSAPGSDSSSGSVAAVPFRVQAMLADQVTPAAGRAVLLSVTAGHASLAACAGANACTLVTDANGQVSSAVTPQTAGVITLTCNDAGVLVSASFVARPAPDQMLVLEAPAAHVLVGDSSRAAVAIVAGDGVTPRAGRAVVFSVVAGQAQLGACAQAGCTVASASDGSAATTVVPLAAGAITVVATAGSLSQTFTFNADRRPDTLALVSQPGDGAFVNEPAAAPFAVRVTAADGTVAAGRSITLSAMNATLTACGAATCVVPADSAGVASTGVIPAAAGTVGLTAVDGGVSLSASFRADTRPDTLSLLSQPADGAFVGERAPVRFAVQAVAPGGAVAAGRSITLSASNATLTACGAATCVVVADGSGVAASEVVPTAAGSVVLSAADGTARLETHFAAVTRPDSLTVTSQPADGSLAGQVAEAPLTVQVLRGDGSRAAAFGVRLTMTVTAGSAVLNACGQPTCTLTTDANGLAGTAVTPGAEGQVTLAIAEADDARVSTTVSFRVRPRPDVLVLVSPLPATLQAGDAATVAVQALLADGKTPAAGKQVSFRLSGAAASLNPCGAATCLVTTDQSGRAAVSLGTSAAGQVTIDMAETGTPGSNPLQASTTVLPRADLLTLVTSPAPLRVGQTAALVLRLTRADGISPVAGTAVRFTAQGGLALEGCAALPCTQTTDQTTDAAGLVSLLLRGLSRGPAQVVAQAETQPASQPVTAQIVVVAQAQSLTALTGTTYVAEGVGFSRTLGVLATEDDAPAAGVPVAWTATGQAGVSLSPTVTGSDGGAQGVASFGPLAAGVESSVTACAWDGVCASFAARGVAASEWQATAAGGEAQAVVAAAFLPVRVRIVDAAGHAVAGAPVAIHQTVTAGDGACPDRGRCPAAPVLATQATMASSDADGLVSVQPISVEGQPTTTHLLFASGTYASLTVLLTRKP